MKITLTPQQKLRLEQMRDIERDSRVCDYVLSEKLRPENGGSQSKLSATQTMHLIEHLIEKTYSHTYQIVAYVKETFGLDYSVSDMNKWLHHNGLATSSRKDESIVFIDAVHPALSTKISQCWIRTGQDKVVKTTGNRSRLNIIGALNLSDIGATIIHDYEGINSETIACFFCKLRKSYPLAHKLHIILDGAGYHRSDLVRDAAFVLNIALHYLPPYSPNLNPIERLWKVMNEKSRNKQCLSN